MLLGVLSLRQPIVKMSRVNNDCMPVQEMNYVFNKSLWQTMASRNMARFG